MLDRNLYFCTNPGCTHFGLREMGNVRKYGHYGKLHRQVFQCKVCHKTWSETSHTTFFHSHYSPETIQRIILSVAEGRGIRETARTLSLSKDSVNKLVRKAGAHCRLVMEELLVNLHLEQCQMDELCSFVKKSLVVAGTSRENTDAPGSGSPWPQNPV